MDFDYKKYSLDKLNEWMHDAISCSEATPQEIYDVIKNVVSENYYIFKNQTERCYELLALLNGNGRGHIQAYDEVMKEREYYEPSPYSKGSWNDFWNDSHTEALTYGEMVAKEDKVIKWQLPVQSCGISGEYFLTFPDDLLEAANLNEGDMVEWIDNNDGSFTMRKANVK